jgi:hypothetical protein
VAANKLYRITENAANPVPVALGVAPAYPCGAPNLNGAVDSGVFIWRDCPSGEWRLKTAAAGGTATFTGTVTSSAVYTSVRGVALSANDFLDYTTNPKQIVFTFHTSGSATDGVNFVPQDYSSNCLSISVPSPLTVYFGPFRAPVNGPFNLETQTACH